MAAKEYIRLTPARQKAGFGVISISRSCLWLGSDHLLLVTTDGYTETYKRFYLRDVQAVFIRKTQRQTVIGVITGLITALLAAVAIGSSTIEIRWVFGILAGVCALPFLVNFIYGPTCSCQLRTAVQTEDIPSLSRVRRTRKVLGRLRPLIAQAQGELTPEDVATRMKEILRSPANSSPAPESAAPSDPNLPPVIG